MLIDVTLLDLKEKAENGELEAQMEMCDAYQFGHKAPVDHHEALYFASRVLNHDRTTLESKGFDYDSFHWMMGQVFHSLNKHFDALLCYQKAVKYIQDTYTVESSERLINKLELRNFIEAIVPPQVSCIYLNGYEIIRY